MLLIWAVLHAVVLSVSAQASSTGDSSCPCLSTASPVYQQARTNISALGLPAEYGFEVCKNWDKGVVLPGIVECDGSAGQPGYCTSHWCFVDTDLCPTDPEECRGMGLLINDPNHASCRSRMALPSAVLPGMGLRYSYETCGYIDNYEVGKVFEVMKDTLLLGVATNDPPYTVVETGRVSAAEYSGVEYAFVQEVLKHMACPTCSLKEPAQLKMVDGWATAESRSKFSSSYTACVNDVAVGNLDICVGDFWVTTERMLMTLFLPSIRSDQFYLVVFEEGLVIDFNDLLQNPFLPFSNEAWGIIFGVVVFLSLTMSVLDYSPDDDEEEVVKVPSYRLLKRLWFSFFYAWCSVFSGKSNFRSKCLSAQVATMFFQLFVLVVVASYKAKLASILILNNLGTGISSVEEALNSGYTICVAAAIEPTIRLNYPTTRTGNFLAYTGSSGDFARHMHAGKCEAAVIHKKKIEQLHAGWIQESDCKKVKDGALTENEGRCETSVSPKGERDDCSIRQVGEIVLSIPIAFPIRNGPLLAPMSVATTKAQNAGEWEKAVRDNLSLFPKTTCTEAGPGQSLGKEAFAGVSILVGLGVVAALVIHKAQNYSHWWPMLDPRRRHQTMEDVDEHQKQILSMLEEVSSVTKRLEAATAKMRTRSADFLRTESAATSKAMDNNKNSSMEPPNNGHRRMDSKRLLDSVDGDGNLTADGVRIKCESGVVSGGEFVPAQTTQAKGPDQADANGRAHPYAGGVAPMLGAMQYPL